MADDTLKLLRTLAALKKAGVSVSIGRAHGPRPKKAAATKAKPKRPRPKKPKAPRKHKAHSGSEHKVVRGKTGKVLHGAARKARMKSLARKRAK